MTLRAVRLDAGDNVVVALDAAARGQSYASVDTPAAEDIPAGHKMALAEIAAGAPIVKYGQVIGFAAGRIAAGGHVHTHNVELRDFERKAAGGAPPAAAPAAEPATFEGYVREDGRVGTRNYLGVITSVNCSATVARYIAAAFDGDKLAGYGTLDGVVALTHGSGCGMGAGEEGMQQLNRTLAGFARHANFAGVLLVGLGCETNQIGTLVENYGLAGSDRIRTLTIQDTGGTRATVDAGIGIITEFAEAERGRRRETVSADRLVVALQCGGSDGYSGISANPALGRAVDRLVRSGGTAILSETPEIYGAEHLLAARAASPDIASRLAERIAWWEDYARRNGSNMDNNPSPGNKQGGITTILEKSLGAVAKGGSTRLEGVYRYAEPVTARGLVFMDSPGYDPASITGQMASGANVVCFTTGRGSVYGSKPAPCIKIATNTPLYDRMGDDMDVNAGRIVDGTAGVAEVGDEIFGMILAVASGQKSRSESLGLGDHEFTPWVFGAQM